MKSERVFRFDFRPLNSPFQFNAGDVAVITDWDKPNIKIKVKKKEYVVPFRDFIVSTRRA